MAYNPFTGSVSGTVGASIIGTVPVTGTFNSSITAYQGGTWATSMVGVASVTQAGIWNVNVNSILGTYQEKNAAIASTIGIPTLFKIDETNSVLTAVSPQSPFPIRGSVATLQGTNPWIISPTSVQLISTSASVATQVNNILTGVSSVMLFGSTNTSIMALVSNQLTGVTSVQLMSTSASIMVNNPAVFGNNNTWTQTNSVISIGATRNDTMTSVTAADGRYSPMTVGPIGENIAANAPINKWITGTASITIAATPLQPIIAAQGASIFTYITGVQIANWTATGSVLIALQKATASNIAYAVVKANDMAVLNYMNPLKTLANAAFTASIAAGTAATSIFISAQGFTSKFDT